MLLTQYLKLQPGESTPFVDIDLTTDTRLFVDPARARFHGAPGASREDVRTVLTSYGQQIARLVMDGDHHALRLLLRPCSEPKETHLGLATRSYEGRGSGTERIETTIDALSDCMDGLLNVGVLGRFEVLPLVVPGMGNDLTSDITTQVLYQQLADFTGRMMQDFPRLGAVTTSVKRPVWDPASAAWVEREVTLPVIDDTPVLLVPRAWVGKAQVFSAARFYQIQVLGERQKRESVVLPSGRLSRPSKKALRERDRGIPVKLRNLTALLEEHDVDPDLIEKFSQYVTDRLRAEAGDAAA